MPNVADLPTRVVTRTAKLASLPLSVAGRATLGLGRRLGGKPAADIAAELQRQTAEQLFKVLGELKGGAMKFGQALSVLEAALPDEMAAPYRDTLTRLQEAAPPLPVARVHQVLREQLGTRWRRRFESFDDQPAAAASIGQVHRAVWSDGRPVAVKIQYPGAGAALLGDLNALSRIGRVLAPLAPGLEIRPLLDELRDRLSEELDYRLEADSQESFADVYDGDTDILVPHVLYGTDQVLVSEWIDGTPLSRIIADGTRDQRNRAGEVYSRFLFSGPERAGMLHADPHPGNYRLMDDGRLGVLDFGAVARLPDGLPAPIGRLLTIASQGDADTLLDGLRDEGFIRPGIDIDPNELLRYLGPFVEPAQAERFHFTRAWMRAQAQRIGDPRSQAYWLGIRLNLPPSYLLIHRVWIGGIGVLSQLEAEVPVHDILARSLPGFV
jgi:predicted unusual protein kinase regulating ubiquinone biosynthesis (AarF/ABC1/UbiB family)